MQSNGDGTVLRLRVWLERGDEIYVGIGSTSLLREIDKLGSLRKAAEALGMSYRRAWGKLKKTEERIGQPLVQKVQGQGQRYVLTPFGQELAERFLKFYLDVEEYARQSAERNLGIAATSASELSANDTERSK